MRCLLRVNCQIVASSCKSTTSLIMVVARLRNPPTALPANQNQGPCAVIGQLLWYSLHQGGTHSHCICGTKVTSLHSSSRLCKFFDWSATADRVKSNLHFMCFIAITPPPPRPQADPFHWFHQNFQDQDTSPSRLLSGGGSVWSDEGTLLQLWHHSWFGRGSLL